MARSLRLVFVLLALLTVPAAAALAQDSVTVVPADSADSARAPGLPSIASTIKPPASPNGALLRSLLLPGWGQFKLKRKLTGVLFIASEATLLTLALNQEAKVRNLRRDPTADSITVDHAVKKREDWYVLLGVNHVLAGLEAYVSAYLWDFPKELKVQALPDGGFRTSVTLPIRIR